MKFLDLYANKYSLSSQEEVFKFFILTLTDSIKYWDYFVNWSKVSQNVRGLEVDLNTINYLVGKDNIEAEFKFLLSEHPSVVRLIPVLLACREKEFKILIGYTGMALEYEDFNFRQHQPLSVKEIDKLCHFAKETGLLDIFRNKLIKSVPDYVTGIEVGLDSNGRKNRGGTAMENIVGSFVKAICEKHGFEYISQVDSEKANRQWGIKLQVDKSDRRFDFAIRQGSKIFLLETNYYGGGGSKLKATAGEYKSLFEFITSHGYSFIWITDGAGWKSTIKPLGEAFEKLNYIMNLKMITDGALDEVFLNG